MNQPFTGLIGYPITPMADDDEPDFTALAHLVRNVAFAGASGVAVLATSGAGATFDRAERRLVVQTAVEASLAVGTNGGARDSAVPVYAAVSAPSTREVVRLAQDAEGVGAAGLLLTPFSYLPLSDAEVRALFVTVAEATSLPLCFYNKPVQTQFDVSAETLAFLAANAHVVAIKETMRREKIADRVKDLRAAVGADFAMGLSADVQLLDQLPDVDAWHSGLAGMLPGEYADVWSHASTGTVQGAALERLRTMAQLLAHMPQAIGALHALSNALGVPTAGPRGPFAAAPEEATGVFRRALG